MASLRSNVARWGLGGAAVAATSAVVGLRVAERRWRRHDVADDPTALPSGDDFEVPTSDGVVLSGTAIGDGPTVVLSHCWTGRREIWAPVARRLVDRGHRVVLYDQRGHGRSSAGDEGWSISRLGTDLREVLLALDIDDAVIGGHSMGGMAAQAFAIEHSDVAAERVRGLALVATAAHGVAKDPAAGRADAVLGNPRIERIMRRRLGLVAVRGSVGRHPRYRHLVAIRDSFVDTPPRVRVAFVRAMRAMDLREGLASVGLPAVVVVGSRDTLTPPPLGRDLARRLPEAELVEIPGAGHMLPLEEPDRVTDLVVGVGTQPELVGGGSMVTA